MSYRNPMFERIRRAKRRQEAADAGEVTHLALDGKRAFEAGESPIVCRYPLDSKAQRAWISGWFARFDAVLGHGSWL